MKKPNRKAMETAVEAENSTNIGEISKEYKRRKGYYLFTKGSENRNGTKRRLEESYISVEWNVRPPSNA